MSLELFVSSVKNFDQLSLSSKIDYFIYYLTIIKEQEGTNARTVDRCFQELKISKYTNTGQYLSSNSKRTRTKPPKFVFNNGLYHLERTYKAKIDAEVNAPRSIVATNNYFSLEIFDNTRQYLSTIAKQAAACYDNGLFDACSVMTRKLLEILIIEAFERFRIDSRIKSSSGNFFYLSDLIDCFISETSWNIGRNAKNSMPTLKKMGDLSAHNRRYIARKGDLDKLKDDLRIVLEELIHLIDYPNWNKNNN